MGLLDIFYQEINRHRDNFKSKEEKRKIIETALKKTLKKFEFLWEDQILTGAYIPEEIKHLFIEFSGDFIVLAVEVDDIFEEEDIVNKLREISKNFKKMTKLTPTMNFKEKISREMGQSLNLIKDINKELQ